MITKLFLTLTDYAIFRRLLWKPVYEVLAKTFTVKDWSFMNYGYAPFNEEPPLHLDKEDEINRYPIQLYHYLATKAELKNNTVLEVGSGRGGGAFYLKKYLHPATVTGLDIAANAVKMAIEHYKGAGLRFVQGSAEDLPFENESFGIVINVESSHTYGSVPRFLSEVERVLSPGGYFLCADIRTAGSMVTFRQQLQSCGMSLLSEENISKNVYRAIELEEPIKEKRIKENVPLRLQKIFREFAGVLGSKAYRELTSGALVYCRFVLQK